MRLTFDACLQSSPHCAGVRTYLPVFCCNNILDHLTVREWISNLFGIPTSNDDPFDTLEEQADAEDFFPTIPALERLSNSLRFCQGLCRRVFQPYDPWVVCNPSQPISPVHRSLAYWKICFSACKDAESAIEMKDVSMTKVS